MAKLLSLDSRIAIGAVDPGMTVPTTSPLMRKGF
jgi:hypothetical protein